MSEQELEEQRLLAAMRASCEPDEGAKQRVLARTLPVLSTPPMPPEAPSSGVVDVLWRAPGLHVRLSAAAVIALGSGIAGYRLSPIGAHTAVTSPDAHVAPDPEPAPPPVAPRMNIPVATNAPLEESPAAQVAPAPGRSSKPRSTRPRMPAATREPPHKKPRGLGQELAALKRVEAAQRAGRATEALTLLEELDRTVPEGQLLEERRAAYVVARCTLGTNAPRSLVDDFVSRFPRSVYLPRLRRQCLDE